MGWILGGMCAVILGLTVLSIFLWTELKEEQARNFNARMISRIQQEQATPMETRVILYDQDHPDV